MTRLPSAPAPCNSGPEPKPEAARTPRSPGANGEAGNLAFGVRKRKPLGRRKLHALRQRRVAERIVSVIQPPPRLSIKELLATAPDRGVKGLVYVERYQHGDRALWAVNWIDDGDAGGWQSLATA
jgi:hypothetical protein